MEIQPVNELLIDTTWKLIIGDEWFVFTFRRGWEYSAPMTKKLHDVFDIKWRRRGWKYNP